MPQKISPKTNHQAAPNLGEKIDNWRPCSPPSGETLIGQYATCERLSVAAHSESLFLANSEAIDNDIWRYLPYGPFDNIAAYQQWMLGECDGADPFFYAIIDNRSGRAWGVASYLRITPEHGTVEVGHINYSPALQNTIVATEAMYMLMKNVFDLGYRRYEWKCNALNERSCQAAQRLGFTFEGIFRQMMVVRGYNRDTAWYSITDKEWPQLNLTFKRWLDPNNFDAQQRQKRSLSSLTAVES